MLHMFFFFNDTATTEIYTLSLHDALPIFPGSCTKPISAPGLFPSDPPDGVNEFVYCYYEYQVIVGQEDRKSTRLNSSHANISYAVFCLKKKKNKTVRTNSYASLISLS